MLGIIHAGAVGPPAKQAKFVERASRPPPLVAQASSLCAAPARFRCHQELFGTLPQGPIGSPVKHEKFMSALALNLEL